MSMEQREQYMAEIQKLEGLLAYAVVHGRQGEDWRIRGELVKTAEALQ